MGNCTTYNDFGYAVLNEEYLAKYMGKAVKPRALDPFDEDLIRAGLEKYNIGEGIKQPVGTYMDKSHVVPEMLGDTVDEHFEQMAKQLIAPALKTIRKLLRIADVTELPVNYAHLLVQEAVPHTAEKPWLKVWQEADLLKSELVVTPDSDWLVFDTETFVQGSRTNMPIIATAVGQDANDRMAYYLWAHESLLNPAIEYKPVLVPVGTDKVVIMHNSSFDAPRMKERYELDSLNNYIICTQSLHTATNGLDGSQRWAKNLAYKARRDASVNAPGFTQYGCGASLVDAYEFHTGKLLDADAKDPRALFVVAKTMGEIADRLYDCFDYAIHDVLYTLELFIAVWPKYRRTAPSYVVIAGQMIMTNCALPVRDDWHEWCVNTEKAWHEADNEITCLLNELADKYHEQWANGDESIEQDHWLKHMDWRRCSKDPSSPLYNVAKWYEHKAIFDVPLKIGAKGRDSHYLLKLCWKNQPLCYSKDLGWHYINNESGKATKLYHAKGDGSNVGSVLTGTYVANMEAGDLHSFDTEDTRAHAIAKLIVQTSFWTGNRGRILALHAEPIENPEDGSKMYVVAPNLRAHGTASGRAIENVFLVAASHTSPKIGSEIANMAYAPVETHKFVGHDVN